MAEVQGSMNFVDSDSDSASDESNTDMVNSSPVIALQATLDSDEDEVEVFSFASPGESCAAEVFPVSQESYDLSLACTMPKQEQQQQQPSCHDSQIITQIEEVGFDIHIHLDAAAGDEQSIIRDDIVVNAQHDDHGALGDAASFANEADELKKSAEATPDMFGLTYRPHKAAKASYTLRTGPADADEIELQEALKSVDERIGIVPGQVPINANTSTVVPGLLTDADDGDNNDDDEFAICDDYFPTHTIVSEPTESKSGICHKNTAEQEELEILASIRLETNLSVVEDKSSNLNIVVSAGSSSSSIQEAFQAVTSIYAAGGSGDMQARADFDKDDNEENDQSMLADAAIKAAAAKKMASRTTFTISEEDEVEDEDDDEDNARDHDVSKDDKNGATKNANRVIDIVPKANNVGKSADELAWDAVENDSHLRKAVPEADSVFAPIVYMSYLADLQSTDLSLWKHKIVPFEARKKTMLGRFGLGSGPKIGKVQPLKESCKAELDWPFLLAQQPWNPNDSVDLRVLQTIYHRLIPSHEGTIPVPANGPHWEKIGFQGLDPCTDVNRAMKMLAVLQCLRLTEGDELDNCKRLHSLSVLYPDSPENPSLEGSGPRGVGKQDLSWPFFCVSIAFTKEALVALRTGELNGFCNELNSVLDVLHAFYKACFYHFRAYLMTERETHHAIHLAKIRDECKQNPHNFLSKYFHATKGSAAKGSHMAPQKKSKPTKQFQPEVVECTNFIDFSTKISANSSKSVPADQPINSSSSKALKFLA